MTGLSIIFSMSSKSLMTPFDFAVRRDKLDSVERALDNREEDLPWDEWRVGEPRPLLGPLIGEPCKEWFEDENDPLIQTDIAQSVLLQFHIACQLTENENLIVDQKFVPLQMNFSIGIRFANLDLNSWLSIFHAV